MNCPHVVWALRQRGLSAIERLVLIYLADKANGSMICWPMLTTIARELELSRRAVQSATVRLAEQHLIRIDARHRQAHTYHILRPNGGAGGEPSQPEVDRPTIKVQDLHPTDEFKVQDLHPKPVLEPVRVQTVHPSVGVLVANLAPKTGFLGARLAPHPPKKESPKKERGSRARARATPMADDWLPPHAMVEFAQGLGITEASVQRAADRFSDWAKSGDRRMADWDAAFRNWLRGDADNPWGKPKDDYPWYAKEIMAETRQ